MKKIGVLVDERFEDFLQQVASFNGISKTMVCSLVLEHQLSYLMKIRRYPIFHQVVEYDLVDEPLSADLRDIAKVDLYGDFKK